MELRQLDEKIALSGGDLNRVKAENAKMDAELNVGKEKVPIAQLEARLNELKQETDEMNAKLKSLKSANVKPITKEEKNKVSKMFAIIFKTDRTVFILIESIQIQKENDKLVTSWRKYKRIANEMVATILENSSMKKSELIVRKITKI